MADIKDLRDGIDKIDKELTRLFVERMEICRQVGQYKAERNLPVLDEKREKELLAQKASVVDDDNRDNVERFFKCIMDISKDEQRKLCEKSKDVVGFCGIEGAYGYFAAKKVGDDVRAFNSFKAVVDAVESGAIDKGVLPIENTTSGSVLEVYDVLGEGSLYIIEEIIMPISHCLLGIGQVEDIETVCSHPQALSQCNGFLERYGYERIQSVNTAIAAMECKAKGDKTVGVIASASCGQLYGLNVLKEAIEDRPGNKTRFVVISRNRLDTTVKNKASITFTLPHRQGALIELINNFKNVNLTKIESRPLGDFEYRFYLDFVSENPEKDINNIMSVYNTIKVLGVYNEAKE